MSKGLVTQQYLTNIADAIRSKNSSSTVYKPSEMAQAINDISTMPTVTKGIVINSFNENGSATDVSIVGMTEIPAYYFSGACDYLSSWMGSVGGNIHFPDNVTSIGNGAFKNCNYLALTSLPSSITSIGDYAFQNCKSLILSSLPSGITKINNYSFEYCTNLALTSLPNGITSIGDYAFHGCTYLALTSLPNGITSIGKNAFYQCFNLALTSLPSEITSIGNYSFYNCTKLKQISLPSGITSIPTNCFNGCTNLEKITLNGDVKNINSGAFYKCTNLDTIVMPNVTSVPTLQSNSLSNTMLDNGDGFIYVPDALVSKFKAGLWADYADYIYGISELS